MGKALAMIIDVGKYNGVLERKLVKKTGRVTRVVGLTIESEGPDLSVGASCVIDGSILAETIGFKDGRALLMPLGFMNGIRPGSSVEAGEQLTITVSDDILGRVFDGLGRPMDGKPPPKGQKLELGGVPPNALTRKRITTPLPLGIKAIDGMLTVGKGQRLGVFSGSGVGKSTLMGMIARNTEAEVNVIALIGERGREVREFLERDLGDEGLKRSVVIVATSDQPALVRLKAAETATRAAEFFRDRGKDVLLLMDSLTRYAMAQREVGLSAGEPPVSRGYTPSVFSIMPKLLERAGNSEKGSITGLYTVLVEGDDMTEPVTDTARSILDGHIALDRKIADRNRYPAIDVLGSVSRVMNDIITPEHREAADVIKSGMAVYSEAEDLINIGAYSRGASAEIDDAIDKRPAIEAFLRQKTDENFSFEEIVAEMESIAG
ncbi:MAG: FliI/YscN family ATPase [Clostridiales bacterium]|jgi:flagellum-specific ATP synthase|nr:FliI/YscN family ATPase [Clostridiales bacterium]